MERDDRTASPPGPGVVPIASAMLGVTTFNTPPRFVLVREFGYAGSHSQGYNYEENGLWSRVGERHYEW